MFLPLAHTTFLSGAQRESLERPQLASAEAQKVLEVVLDFCQKKEEEKDRGRIIIMGLMNDYSFTHPNSIY